MLRLNRRFAFLVLIGVAGLSGCQQQGWVSRESTQGKELEKLHEQKNAVTVEAPADWPLRFQPVEIQKQFSEQSGTQFRAVLHASFTGKPADIQPNFARHLKEQDGRLLRTVIVRIQYLNAQGQLLDSEVSEVDPFQYRTTTVLHRFAKAGAVDRVKLTLESATWVDSPDTALPKSSRDPLEETKLPVNEE